MVKFKDMILFSKMIDRIGISKFVSGLEDKLSKIDEKNNLELKTIKDPEQRANRKKDLENQKKNIYTIDVVSFLASNLHVIETDLVVYLERTSSLKKEEVQEMEIIEIWEVLKNTFKDGVPTELKNKIGNLKKTVLSKT